MSDFVETLGTESRVVSRLSRIGLVVESVPYKEGVVPIRVEKVGSRFKVTDGRRVFGTHGTRKEANAQVQAINISKAKRRG